MLRSVRTTVYLPDDLLQASEKFAAETNRTLTAVIEDALRETLSRRDRVRAASPVQLPTFKGDGLLPGVDLDNSADLLDLMERSDAVR